MLQIATTLLCDSVFVTFVGQIPTEAATGAAVRVIGAQLIPIDLLQLRRLMPSAMTHECVRLLIPQRPPLTASRVRLLAQRGSVEPRRPIS